MLSLGGVKASQGLSYWEKEDYYFKDNSFEVINGGEYWNEGKERIDFGNFIKAVETRINDTGGSIRGDDKIAEDLTFSAPKSVSLIAGLDKAEREKIFSAHKEAVQKTVEFAIENGMIQTRIDDKPAPVKDESILAVRVDHFTSRNGDPQLHSHVLIANSVEQEWTGKYSALYLREVYENKKLLGAVYQQELAKNLEKLGYSIEWNEKGTFEIKGFSSEQLKEFSTRRSEIENKMEELKEKGLEGGKVNEIATLETRTAKKEYDIRELEENWQERAIKMGIEVENLKDMKEEKDELEREVEELQKEVIVEKILSEQINNMGFAKDYEILLKAQREYAKNGLLSSLEETKEKLEKIKEKYFSEKGYIKLGKDKLGREKYTDLNVMSANLRNYEGILRDNQKALNQGKAEQSLEKFQENLEKEKGFRLSEEQAKMVIDIAKSKSDYAVLGRAGAGKTTMMSALKNIYNELGYSILGVSISGSASANLEKETGIKSFTIDSLSFKDIQKFKNVGLIIVDEAGMLDAKRVTAVKEIAEKLNAKILYVGDTEQLKPVGAGDPFSKIVETAKEKGAFGELTEIFRQKNPEYRSAVISSAFEENKSAFEKLENLGWVHEISSKKERFNAIKEEYLKTVEKGKDVIVIAYRNKDVQRLNNEIRFEMLRNGRIDKENQINIEVRNSEGKVIGEKEFAIGDRIIFLKNSGEIKNGMRGEITGIDKENQIMRVEVKGFGEKEINFGKYKYFDYGYAMTVHKSQGQTVDKVIFSADKNVSSNLFYTAISRGREEARIYINPDEKEKFLERITNPENKTDIVEMKAKEVYGRDQNGYKTKENQEKGFEKFKEEIKGNEIEKAKAVNLITDGNYEIYERYSAREDIKSMVKENAEREILLDTEKAKEYLENGFKNMQEEVKEKINEDEKIYPEIEIRELKDELKEGIMEEKEAENILTGMNDVFIELKAETEAQEQVEKIEQEISYHR